MNLRNMGIGARLWLGIGAILLSTGLLWVVSNASHQRERSASAAALKMSQERQAILLDMRQALMASAIAVRNMGLSEVVEAVQAAEAEAHLQREKYLASMGKLERNTLSGAEKTLIEQLRAIDNAMDRDFKEAVGLASQFNTEQAAKLIVGKIDPASARAIQGLNELLVLQERRAADEASQQAANAAALERVVGIAGLVVMLLAGLGVWALTRSIVRPLRVAMGVASTVASGNLTSRIEALGQDETGRLLTSLQAMNAQLRSMVGQIQTSTESLARASSEVSTGNQELSTRTERTASSLDEVASLLERMTAQVAGLAEAAHQSQQLVAGAAELAGSGGTVVARVIDTMQDIQASSGRMATIVGVIDAIAFQTNILALNAAVEAARAGDQGRGFAVVAGEVRTLAQRSAQSAREIKALIEASIDKVEAGSRLVVDAGDTMQRIVASVGEVKSVIGEITTAAQMQRDGIAEINASVTPINGMTQQNAALVEQSAAATESMREQCQRLSGLVGEFHLG